MNEKNKIEETLCGHPDGIKKFEEILQGLFCIDCIELCPRCKRIEAERILECNEGLCMSCIQDIVVDEERELNE